MGLGRIGSAVIVGMVLLVTLWLVSLPFGLVELWWQHHWGLGPFDVLAWLDAQWAMLGAEAVSAMLTIVLLVGLAGPLPALVARRRAGVRRDRGAVRVRLGLAARRRHASAPRPALARRRRADRARRARERHSCRVEDVSSWTNQANAFTVGFGPSTHVVLWNTLLDGRFTRGEEDVVIAHELGHVRSRHILKAIGWTALVVLPTLWLLALALRRRGGLGRPGEPAVAFLVLAVLALVTAPLENAVSRRYEAEADWRALNATRDPASTTSSSAASSGRASSSRTRRSGTTSGSRTTRR